MQLTFYRVVALSLFVAALSLFKLLTSCQLEQTMSSFHGTEDCILYPSCFDANAGLFEGVLTYVLKKSGSGELTRADLFGG